MKGRTIAVAVAALAVGVTACGGGGGDQALSANKPKVTPPTRVQKCGGHVVLAWAKVTSLEAVSTVRANQASTDFFARYGTDSAEGLTYREGVGPALRGELGKNWIDDAERGCREHGVYSSEPSPDAALCTTYGTCTKPPPCTAYDEDGACKEPAP